MAPFHLNMEQCHLLSLLTSLTSADEVHLASGYFNLTKAYRKTLIDQCQAQVNILAASAEVCVASSIPR
jgi:phosphatidylserine/phosphatidylglycerophosphate/cardiolipin synthase-like enzyme